MTDTCSLSPWWGKEEQTEPMNVPLMTGTGVSHNSGMPLRPISSYVSKLVALETCSLHWLAKSPEFLPHRDD